VALVRLVGLDPRRCFVGGDWRGVDFGANNLRGFDFSGADLRYANISRATGLDGIITDAATRIPINRSVLLDTETTGREPQDDRVIEVAALELINDVPTGRHFHALVDPQRDVSEEATRVHGFTRGDLQGKPTFSEIAHGLIAFFGDAKLIAHNAPFDAAFLNMEFGRLGLPLLAEERIVDTLALAKAHFPGMRNGLDALSRRLGIDLSERTTHSLLFDCRLLAEVYLELTGSRQEPAAAPKQPKIKDGRLRRRK
jgi:DNA polymerase-3 subunit epsilon